MTFDERLALARVREAREGVIATLQHQFAHGAIDIDEFERRVTHAHTSESLPEIEALLVDLPVLEAGLPALPSVATVDLVPSSQIQDSQTLRGVMSATTRGGAWSVPRNLSIKSLMSSMVLDLREARFPSGFVDIDIRCVMSSIEIIVPPRLAVQTDGSALLGTFEHLQRAAANPDLDAPILRVRGRAFMSSVEVRVALPSESGGEEAASSREPRDRLGTRARPAALPAPEK